MTTPPVASAGILGRLTPKVLPPTIGTQPGMETWMPLRAPIARLMRPMTALIGSRTAPLMPSKARLAMPFRPPQMLDSRSFTARKASGIADLTQLTTGEMTALMPFQTLETTVLIAFRTPVMIDFHTLT